MRSKADFILSESSKQVESYAHRFAVAMDVTYSNSRRYTFDDNSWIEITVNYKGEVEGIETWSGNED